MPAHNYFSKNDLVLRYLYRAGTLFDSPAIGYVPIAVAPALKSKLQSIDVSEYVQGHSSYKATLRTLIQ